MLGSSRRPLTRLVAAMMAIALAMSPAVALAEGEADGGGVVLVAAGESIWEGDWNYEVDGDGKATIVYYNCNGRDDKVVIPSTLGDRPVTAIGFAAFRGCSAESVVVPEGVATIGECAFVDCINLNRVSLPASVAFIEDDPFHGCHETVDVYYAGSHAAWERVERPSQWDDSGNVDVLRVHCAGLDTYSVSSEPERGGTAEATVVATYGLNDHGFPITDNSYVQTVVTATPAEGWCFVEWRDRDGNPVNTPVDYPWDPDVVYPENPYWYRGVEEEIEVVAVFEPESDGDVPGSLPPAPAAATLTFDLAGGTLDGQSGTITVEATVGDTIKLPAAPTREGYKFRCWQGSEYAAGAEYLVEGDHSFTAAWDEVREEDTSEKTDSGESGAKKKSSDSGKSSGSSAKQASASKLPSTGDPATTAYALATIGAAALAAGSAARGRRRRG